MEEYLRWLINVYTHRFAVSLDNAETVREAIAIFRSHGARWPHEEDFVPMVAAEMVERLEALPKESIEPFLRILSRTADAVRHRLARAARNEVERRAVKNVDQIPDPLRAEVVSHAMIDELVSGFTLEEQTVLTLYFDGVGVEHMAKNLKVSVRTAYRRLQEIKERIARQARG